MTNKVPSSPYPSICCLLFSNRPSLKRAGYKFDCRRFAGGNLFVSGQSRGSGFGRLFLQRREQPLLHDNAEIRLHIAKCEPHSQRRMGVDNSCLGLEVFVRLENLHQDRSFRTKWSGCVHIAPVQTQFLNGRGDACTGRTFGCDLSGGHERKPQSAALLVHAVRQSWDGPSTVNQNRKECVKWPVSVPCTLPYNPSCPPLKDVGSVQRGIHGKRPT
jgi:hypothetical protein